ncbi:MAG: hypothetical protein GY797_41285 [Deltaproteobacteria bacterium]|nr:hypothetical protein [Deltaproteobacteria bacterium]
MPNIPAICNNPNCGAIFKSPFSLKAKNLTLKNISIACPKCGSDGKVPDGKYDAIGDTLFASLKNITDINALKKSLELLKREFQSKKEPDIIKENLEKEIPELKKVWGLLPITSKDAQFYIFLIINFLMLVINSFQLLKSDEKDVTIIQQEITNQSFQNFYLGNESLLHDSHNDNPIEKKYNQEE